MKVKQQPDDFQVEEVTDVRAGTDGPFAFYRLEKRGWTTPDALEAVRRRWHLNPRRLSFAGLKDRHAATVQYLTIDHGAQRGLTQQGLTLIYLGQVPAPYTSADLRANRFRVTVRDLSPAASARARQALDEVRTEGVPNYFDDQRFGSLGPGEESVARFLILGRYEDALRLALTAPYEHDRAPAMREKAILRSCWGDWALCKERLPGGHTRDLMTYLARRPSAFRGALERLRPELSGLYLSAFQSDVWNRVLARWLERRCRPDQLLRVRLRPGTVPMHRGLEEAQLRELADLRLPLPEARTRLDATDPRWPLIQEVLAEEDLGWEQLKLKGLRRPFFTRGERPALCLPAGLAYQAGPDERHPQREQLEMTFELPRGSYATLLIKRATASFP
jgi:tRNA pseudouridine13 synthase